MRRVTPLEGRRVTVVTNNLGSTSETFLRSKVHGLAAAGAGVTVLHTGERELDLGEIAAPGSITVRRSVLGNRSTMTLLGLRSVAGSRQRLATARGAGVRAARTTLVSSALRSEVESTRPELLIFGFSGLAVAYLEVLEQPHSYAVVVSCRGSAEKIVPVLHPSRREALARVMAVADLVHCVSDDMADTVADMGADRERIFVNRPAIDPAYFDASATGVRSQRATIRLLTVGRLHWAKAVDLLIVTLSKLRRDGLAVELVVVGSGPEEEHLRFLAHSLGLASSVAFRGSLDPEGVRRELRDADVYVLPSLSEGINNTVLEAMAMRVPVVVSAVGGMPEVIEDGVNGRLVPVGQPEAMAAAVNDLISRPDTEAMVEAARGTVLDRFTIDRQQMAFSERYARLLEEARWHG